MKDTILLYTKKIKNYTLDLIDYVTNLLYENINVLLFSFLILSISFSVIKQLFFHGYNVDAYHIFALSLRKYILNGEKDYLFFNYYAKNRILYPLIIALLHICFPINIALLAATINTIFSFASLLIIRKLTILYYQDKKIAELSMLFIITSYNFLNYWFNILTDFVGLFFFIAFLYSLVKFQETTNYFMLPNSIIFLFFSVLSREVYILGIILYVFVIKSYKIRLTIIFVFCIFLIIIFGFFHTYIPFINQFIAPRYREYYYSQEYWKLLISLQNKWKTPYYTITFLKGLLKTGILIGSVIIIILRYKVGKEFFKDIVSKKPNILNIWFLLFFVFYSFFYSNTFSASGLRYWLPISWIPLVFISKILIKYKTQQIIKLSVIFILVLFPISWSVGELYINRNTNNGIPPTFRENIYYNDMSDIHSISYYNKSSLSLEVLNDSFIYTEIISNQNKSDFELTSFSISVWRNITQNIQITVRMKSLNLSRWGINLYSAYKNYYPGHDKLEISIVNHDMNENFTTYIFRYETSFLLRYITFFLEGNHSTYAIWDYCMILVT